MSEALLITSQSTVGGFQLRVPTFFPVETNFLSKLVIGDPNFDVVCGDSKLC